MKAEELMIDDWVQIRHPKGLPDANGIQISEIDSSGHSICFFSDIAEGELTLSLDDIAPIPITPEILEKNGFRKDDETDQWYFKSENRLDLGLLAVGIDDGCGVGLCVMRNGAITYYCKYVHELQHYLRLIGGAEEIIL